jgi:hypothetical protein
VKTAARIAIRPGVTANTVRHSVIRDSVKVSLSPQLFKIFLLIGKAKFGVTPERLFAAIYADSIDGGPLTGRKAMHVQRVNLNRRPAHRICRLGLPRSRVRASNFYSRQWVRRRSKSPTAKGSYSMTKPNLRADTDPVVDAITTPDDPFDLSKLRLDQSFVESAGVKKLLTTVPVRKPEKQTFIRVHRGDCFEANSRRHHRSRSDGTPCSWRSMPAPSSGASVPWAGQCRPTFSTYSPNFATARTASQRRRVPVWSEL